MEKFRKIKNVQVNNFNLRYFFCLFNKIIRNFFIIILFNSRSFSSNIDLLIFGTVNYADGLGRIPLTFLKMLKSDLNLKFQYPFNNFNNLSNEIDEEIRNLFIKEVKENDEIFSNTFIYTDSLWSFEKKNIINFKDFKIKIAYSMFEADLIPEKWVKTLNDYFDLVVVPDDFFIKVYKDSGVKIPIFVLPIPLYLNDFLNYEKIKDIKKPFTFGMSASFWGNFKNQYLLLEEFAKLFGNNSNFLLKIHSRLSDQKTASDFGQKIKNMNLKNVEFIYDNLSYNDFLDFLASIDCYVSISKGEGFSIVPREALALGIPCIVSDNTAQKTICLSGYVRILESKILEPAFYSGMKCGYQFNCNRIDLDNAMKDVYNNYQFYRGKACLAKEWVKQYLPENLRSKYLSLIKPKKVILGDNDIILDDAIITTSKLLYAKYLEIQ